MASNAAAAPAPSPSAPTISVPPTNWMRRDVLIALDMLKNLNFSQIGDELAAAGKDPLVTAEHIAEIAVAAATVAGVPGAQVAASFLPFAVKLLDFAHTTMHLFGGPDGDAAVVATKISSPAGIRAPSTVLATAV